MAEKTDGLRFRWEKSLRDSESLSTKARHIGHLMATYSNADGTKVHPGAELLAKGSGMSLRSVHTATVELRTSGWVELVRAGNARRGHADEYQLQIPTLVVAPSSANPAPDELGSSANPAPSTANCAGSGATEVRSGANNDTPPEHRHQTTDTRSSKPDQGSSVAEDIGQRRQSVRSSWGKKRSAPIAGSPKALAIEAPSFFD